MSSATVAADSTLSVIGYQSIGLGEERRLVALWPFDGTLAELAGRGGVVVGEIYPRVAYAVAVAEGAPGERGLEPLSRNIRDVRREALERLRRSTWVKTHGVRLNVADLAVALESADAFDALMAAAALLRCVLEGEPLSAGEHGVAEGGILGSGAVVLERRVAAPRLRSAASRVALASAIRCPIPGCNHQFAQGRRGWDAHVASLRRHRDWHPELADPRERRARFREEFSSFFP